MNPIQLQVIVLLLMMLFGAVTIVITNRPRRDD